MRTIEEVKEWLVRADKVWGLDSQTRAVGSFERGFAIGKQSMANYCLEFIHSEPPCTHKRVTYLVLDYLPGGVNGWYLIGYGSLESVRIKHCPDCGEKLQ